jgi:ABC-type bacteriocin/lantibiotic exporter with double-glycine peptidase domain
VRQRRLTDCGVAVVAMSANVSWTEAKHAIFGVARRSRYLTTHADLRRAFDLLGVGWVGRPRKFRAWAEIAGPAIVTVRALPPNEHLLHWVLFHRKGDKLTVVDPDIRRGTLARTDFKRLDALDYWLLDPDTFGRREPRQLVRALADAGPLRPFRRGS